MKNYKKILITVLCIMPAIAKAQHNRLDSLTTALIVAKSDSAKFIALGEMANYYVETDRAKVINYLDEALPIAKRNKKLLDEATDLQFKGYELFSLGKYATAFECLQRSIEIGENPDNENNAWGQDKGETIHKFRFSNLALAHFVMGHLKGKANDIQGQIDEYKKTVKIAKEINDYTTLGLANLNLGSIYNDMDKTDSALIFEKNSESSFKRSGYYTYLGSVYANIGDINLKRGDGKIALNFYHKALIADLLTHNLYGETYIYGELADYFTIHQQKDSSLYYANKALAAAKRSKMRNMGDILECLYKSYRLNGIIDSAYKYQGLALIIKDSSNKTDLKNLGDFEKLSMKRQSRLQQLEKEKADTEAWIRTYALLAIIGVVLLVAFITYRNSRQRKKANYLLREQKEEVAAQRDKLSQALEELKTTQTQLVLHEKMASLGELTAGIAHEIQNPLNFVNNFSEVSIELLTEMKEEAEAGNKEDVIAIANDLTQNLEKINHHGKRADFIVKGMLQHSRTSTGEKQDTNINVLAEEFFKLSYHGLRAIDKNFNAELITNFDENLPKVNIVQQDIGRVLLNMFNNAFYAVNQKQKTAGPDYKPEITVSTSIEKNTLIIKVKDNGNGIPYAIKDKIMQPFFTTKPTGEGTGLGLSLSYDIVVKGHGGTITVDTKENEFTEFTITLPIS